MVHRLKTWPQLFEDVVNGKKLAEFRLNDRDYKVGDILNLREWNPESREYTGKETWVIVQHIQEGFGIPESYVLMSIVVVVT